MGIIGKILKKEDSSDEVKKTDDKKKSEVKIEKGSKPKAPVAAQNLVQDELTEEACLPVGTEHPRPEKPKAPVKTKKIAKRVDTKAYKVLSHPLVSEKATDLAMDNKYIFIVPLSANKSEIAKTVTNVYGVKPVSVNVMKKLGKKVRRGRNFNYQKNMKKAVVTLKPGDKIEVYEGV